MSYLRTGLLLGLLFVLSACAFKRPEMVAGLEGLQSSPDPIFPTSEQDRGREGWVIVAYTVAGSGVVKDVRVKESSGNSAFEKAAIRAVDQWRYLPGDVRHLTTLVSFTIEGSPVQVSIDFMNLNDLAHEFINIGRLDAAEALLVEMRGEPDLTAYALAYSYLVEERIAYERGDRTAELRALRKAMLGNGRWLAEDAYLECLRTAVVLAIELGDFASALRDYELLTESRKGRELAADLEQHIAVVQERLEGAELGAGPYLVADSGVAVNKRRTLRGRKGWTGYGDRREPGQGIIPANRTPSSPSDSGPSAPSRPSSPRSPPPVDK